MPGHPRDLVHHACLNDPGGPDAPPVRWVFTEDGHDFAVAVKDRVLTTDDALLLRLARDGIGLTLEGRRRSVPTSSAASGSRSWRSSPGGSPGSTSTTRRRPASPALRALIDYLLQLRQAR